MGPGSCHNSTQGGLDVDGDIESTIHVSDPDKTNDTTRVWLRRMTVAGAIAAVLADAPKKPPVERGVKYAR